MSGLKFLQTDLHESLDLLVESKSQNESPKYYISGPYMMAEKKNENGRIYSLKEMQKEAERYTTEMINKRRALGELNHPQTTEVDPSKACHLVVELRQDSNFFIGKSLILETPMGQLLKALLKDKIQMGISTRGLGNLIESIEGKKVTNFHLICFDVVHQPSVQNAMLEAVLESKEWTIGPDGRVIEVCENAKRYLNNAVSVFPKHDREEFIKNQLISLISKLKQYS